MVSKGIDSWVWVRQIVYVYGGGWVIYLIFIEVGILNMSFMWMEFDTNDCNQWGKRHELRNSVGVRLILNFVYFVGHPIHRLWNNDVILNFVCLKSIYTA